MDPKKYLYSLAQAVSKRSGISIATCQVVLPALFDELRYILCEGRYRCVAIESFGVLTVRELPRRHYLRRMPNGTVKKVQLEPRLVLKFSPTRNMRQEVEASRFDPTRHSFVVHPDDHPLRTRRKMKYKSKCSKIYPMMGQVHKEETGTPNYTEIKILRGREDER